MKTSRILKIFMVAAAALSLASCNKFEDPYTTKGKSPLADPSNIKVDADYKQATITWDAVNGADQYYYEVRNASNFVSKKGFTRSNSFYVGGLKQLTDYTFYVKAVPSADDAASVAGSKLVKTEFKTGDASAYIWEKVGKVLVGGEDTGRTATLQYEYATGIYTIMGWYGYEGYDIYFTLSDAGDEWIWSEDSPCFWWADYPANAYCFYDGGKGAGYTWIYTPYTSFNGGADGGKSGGYMDVWGWIENATWTSWALEW